MSLYPHRQRYDTAAQGRRRSAGTLVLLGLIGTAGCGGGGGSGGTQSSSQPTALALGTPSSVTGSAANGLAYTFSEASATVSGQPGLVYTLHENNGGSAPVTVIAGQDATTKALFPQMTIRLLDPQGRAVSLPPVAGTQTLTLNPGDTADASLTLNLAYFTQTGQYTATVSADGTAGVPALASVLVVSAH